MGFKFRKQIGPKGFKINIGRRGISSVSTRIAPGITHNSSRGLTLSVPGTGMSYNVRQEPSQNAFSPVGESQAKLNQRIGYNRGWKEFTGGYSGKAMIAVAFGINLAELSMKSMVL